MIAAFSHKIADFLVREKTIETQYKDVYEYGLELCISSLISIFILIAMSAVSGKYKEGFLFYLVFCLTRLFCGGYHAKSYMKCKGMLFLILCAVFTLQGMWKAIPAYGIVGIWCCCAMTIIFYAPIENENKALSAKEKKNSKYISMMLLGLWALVESILYALQSQLVGIIPITLFLIAILMLLEKSREKICKGGKSNEKGK